MASKLTIAMSASFAAFESEARISGSWNVRQDSVPSSPAPLSTTTFAPHTDLHAQLQFYADAVVAHYAEKYPNLALSLSYKDATREVSIASGNVSGRVPTPRDTFLYGSGTKPFTAAAVLRLIDSGKVKATDKVSDIINPYMAAHGQPSLEHFFGDAVKNATVLELIRMGAGIRDFEDDYAFDQWALAPENSSNFWDYPYDAMAFAVSEQNTKGKGPLYCNPGNCTAYSSTSYEIAGLVLAAVLEPTVDWYNFDLGSAVFPDRRYYPDTMFPPIGNGTTKLSSYLTIPGTSVSSTWEQTTIYEQNPSILGWTCGNMVASPRDVARFFYYLLDDVPGNHPPHMLLSDSSREEMTDFQTLSTGWAAGVLRYGAGMMDLNYGSFNKTLNQTGLNVHGHEGDTYGFLSSQGYIPALHGGYSVVSNVDNSGPLYRVICYFLQTVNSAVTGEKADFGCKPLADAASIIV